MADDENKECPPCLQHVPLWMVTFADMSSLLMAFFVLLTILIPQGTSSAEQTKEALESIQRAFSGQIVGGKTISQGKLVNMGMNFNKLPSMTKSMNDFSKLLDKVKELFSNEIKSKKITIEETKDGFSISLVGDLYFSPGSSELAKEATPVLGKIGDLIFDLQKSNIDNGIKIKGYADASIIRPGSPKYKNNLSLTSSRSSAVVDFFWTYGVSPTRLLEGRTLAKFQAIGYGEFQPLEGNVTPEQRAYNRRVEIEFLNDPSAK